MRRMSVDLGGAADLHCHFGPDAHRERSVDAFQAAREAAAAGHRAVVLKSHDFPTASLAWSVGQVVPGIAVFGGICCDREVGGVNPAAVEVALRLFWHAVLGDWFQRLDDALRGPALGLHAELVECLA